MAGAGRAGAYRISAGRAGVRRAGAKAETLYIAQIIRKSKGTARK